MNFAISTRVISFTMYSIFNYLISPFISRVEIFDTKITSALKYNLALLGQKRF